MKSYIVYFLLFILAGFGCDMYHSRECPAFYYDYNQWQPIDKNDTITFLTSDDKEVEYFLKE